MLAGSNLVSPLRVLFGSTEAVSVKHDPLGLFSAVTPVLSAGVFNVTVMNQSYQSSTLSNALTVVDIPPEEITRLDVGKSSDNPVLSWMPVTKAIDDYPIQPTQYSVYRSETVPFDKDAGHRIDTTDGNITSWTDTSSGAIEFYLVTASYGGAEGQ